MAKTSAMKDKTTPRCPPVILEGLLQQRSPWSPEDCLRLSQVPGRAGKDGITSGHQDLPLSLPCSRAQGSMEIYH